MKLYRGSNVVVKDPRIINSNRNLDFGVGFYLTSDLSQAEKWARAVVERRGEGVPIVSVFDYKKDKDLKMLTFDEPSVKWLKFVSDNRKNVFIKNQYDIIVGPVANDNTMPVINLYLSGQYDEKEALRRLLPQNLKDQYVFKSENALKCLKFVEEKHYE